MAPVRHGGSMMFTAENYIDEEKPNMSKSGILRGIITEKLSTAAREILAVVERTVADYEEEASGFRREIERQRRQLELLQPRVKLPRTGKSKRKRPEKLREDPGMIPKRIRDDPKDPEHAASRSGSSTVQTGMKGYSKPACPRTHVDVTVRLLESPEIHILSSVVLRKIPTMVLKCPLDLPEPAFLDLLTSSYPQLAAGEPFDILRMKRRMRLRPLKLKTLTPEEIFAARSPMLFIRLRRTPVQMDVSEALITESTSADPPVLNNNETGSQTSVAGDADGSDERIQPITSTPQQQEQEAAESHMDSVEPQIHLDEVVKSDGQEEECSVIDVPLAPVLTGNHQSEIQTSSVGDIQPISSSSEPGNSSTDTDNTSDDEEAEGGDQDAGRHTEGRTSKVTCRVCGKLFRQLGSLLSHVWDHVNEPHSICGVCGERLESAETLKEHVTHHTKGFSLGHFGKDPLSSVGLNRRVAKQQAGNLFKCKICSRAFSTTAALRNHSWVHQDRTPVRCHFCLKSFALKADFLAHRKLHASCRGHSCRHCEKAYLSEAMLKEHEKTHGRTDHQRSLGADTSWACGLCNVSFESKEALKTHMSDHFGEALFKCHECGSCFSQGVDFNRHVMTHSAVRPCVSTICGTVSDGKDALEVHMRTRDGEAPVGHPEPGCGNAQEEPHCS